MTTTKINENLTVFGCVSDLHSHAVRVFDPLCEDVFNDYVRFLKYRLENWKPTIEKKFTRFDYLLQALIVEVLREVGEGNKEE